MAFIESSVKKAWQALLLRLSNREVFHRESNEVLPLVEIVASALEEGEPPETTLRSRLRISVKYLLWL